MRAVSSLLLTLALLVGHDAARADGLVPAAPGDPAVQGQCYATGSTGPRVPCVLQGRTWSKVLGSTDDGSGLSVTVGPNAASIEARLRTTAAGIDLLAYVPLGDVRAGRDVAPQFNAAVAAAKAAGARLIVPGVSGHCYVIGSTIDFSGVEIAGGGGCVQTNAAIDMFKSSTSPGSIHDLTIYHNGSSGRVLDITSEASKIQNNKITAGNTSASGVLVEFTASNTHIRFNDFSNFRSGSLTWRNIRNDPKKISINNQVVGNYFGGPGSGGWIGDDGRSPRPEGMLVAYNESVLTGGPFLTISSVLSARIFGNMMDQGSGAGALRFEPGGYKGYGIDGVLVQGNYISAAAAGAPAIVSIKNDNGASAGGVSIVNNQISFGSAAAQLASGFKGHFSGNYMHGFSGSSCILLSEGSLLSAVDFGSAGQCVDKPFISVSGNPHPGSTHTKKLVTYDTATGKGYINVSHGLAAKPTKFQATASTAGTGGASIGSVSIFVAAVDDINVTLSVNVSNINTQGKIFITLDSEI